MNATRSFTCLDLGSQDKSGEPSWTAPRTTSKPSAGSWRRYPRAGNPNGIRGPGSALGIGPNEEPESAAMAPEVDRPKQRDCLLGDDRRAVQAKRRRLPSRPNWHRDKLRPWAVEGSLRSVEPAEYLEVLRDRATAL